MIIIVIIIVPIVVLIFDTIVTVIIVVLVVIFVVPSQDCSIFLTILSEVYLLVSEASIVWSIAFNLLLSSLFVALTLVSG